MAGPQRARLPRLTDRLALGRTGIRISPVCLGMVRRPDTIAAAFDAGANFFFLTADLHWPYYEASRQGLAALLRRGKRIREQIVVAAASYVAQPEFTEGALSEVIEGVPGLGRIDIAIAGGAYGADLPARLAVLHEVRHRSRLGFRAIAATFHDRAAALRATNDGAVDLTMLRYNPSHPGAATDVFPHLSARRRAPIYGFTNTWGYVEPRRFKALGLGREYWRPRHADYYRFALTPPQMDGLLCAPGTPEELSALVAALDEGPLDEESCQYLVDVAALAEGRARLRS
jgi:hypothetical protein